MGAAAPVARPIQAPIFAPGPTSTNKNRSGLLQSRLRTIATLGDPFAAPTFAPARTTNYKNYNKAMSRLNKVMSEDQKRLLGLLEILKIQKNA